MDSVPIGLRDWSAAAPLLADARPQRREIAERRLSACAEQRDDLAQNVVIRMLEAFDRAEMTADELEATLRWAGFLRTRSTSAHGVE